MPERARLQGAGIATQSSQPSVSRWIVIFAITAIVGAFLEILVVFPQIDLTVSGWFYLKSQGFYLRDTWLFEELAGLARYGSRALGVFLLVCTLVAYHRKAPVLKLSGKAWLFLFLSLLLGPGLIANVVLKDHWGRARPRDVVEFGGPANFSPALYRSNQCQENCSFVSGDAAFGFYLPSFTYVVAPRNRRKVFTGTLVIGSLFAFARVMIGAHFLSDVLFAAVIVFLVIVFLRTLMFRQERNVYTWRQFISEIEN